ncbi:hypothetical protein PIROE2DRAFT_60186 [Piromyces sp. E2]|nr:hypothetical protein PIROE2DRAFT_60186 [Piromyces sp. E2]|eukprot:OUM65197.1 hypothetical protein PIROE2DRAFT_60186 [Piromyces sp. E2]
MELPKLKFISKTKFNSEISNYDALVIIFNFNLNTILETPLLKPFSKCISNQYSIDASIGKAISIIHTEGAPEPNNKNGTINQEFVNFKQVTLLGALSGLYIPLEAREHFKKNISNITNIGVMVENESADINEQLRIVEAYQQGRQLAQDIGGTSPERGNPLQCAEIIKTAFKETNVEINIIKDYSIIEKEYPLMAAVGRSSSTVEKHTPCVVKLTYKSPDQSQVKNNLFFVGKGVTFDSGGMDLKISGTMRGMSRDKGGASICAGIVYIAQKLAVKHVNVTAYLGFVRNSIGSHSYVCDEIITSRSGRRVLVANTDAEGRMTMGDLLTVAKENARDDNVGRTLQDFGQIWGDPFEVSRIRKEDFQVVKGNGITEDVIQGNDKPSTMTSRGHQFPAAFLTLISRLDEHGTTSECPIAYTHLDIAGCYGKWSNYWGLGSNGNPIIAIASSFIN